MSANFDFRWAYVVRCVMLVQFIVACGTDIDKIKTCSQGQGGSTSCKGSDDAAGKTGAIDDRTDEEKPPFAQPPSSADAGAQPTPKPTPVATGSVGPGPSGTPGSGFGVDGTLTCADYVTRFWKVGAQSYEEAPGPIFTKLKYTTSVLSVTGANVTIRALLETPDTAQNVDEQLTFDACTNGYLSAVPKTSVPCPLQFLADETLSIGGVTYNAKKYKIGECTLESGKTFSSNVWRVKELPLWGVIKREVSGTIVPSQLNGLISATTKSWLFQ